MKRGKKLRGRAIPLAPSRRVQNDFLHFAVKVPILPVQRRMALGALLAARKACPHRPPWTVLFLKAYAILAQRIPDLRRVYIGLPRPHLYEYPSSVAMIAVERMDVEPTQVLIGRIKDPAERPLAELVAILRHFNEAPLAQIKEFHRVLVLRFLMWLALNIGPRRVKFFGNFGLSVYSALGADSLRPLAPSTVVLNYGVIGADGSVDVRFNYDHRVMDGATVARALQALEKVLTHEIVDELAIWR